LDRDQNILTGSGLIKLFSQSHWMSLLRHLQMPIYNRRWFPQTNTCRQETLTDCAFIIDTLLAI